MAELITDSGRKAIIKIAEISQLARALNLMPKPEDFAVKNNTTKKKLKGEALEKFDGNGICRFKLRRPDCTGA
jgi:hypothetical protein